MAVLSQPGSEQRNPLQPQPPSAVDLSYTRQSGGGGLAKTCARVPRSASRRTVELLRDYPHPGWVPAGRRRPCCPPRTRTPHVIFPYGTLWQPSAGLLCCVPHQESLRGAALCWDVPAAAALTERRAEGTANDRSRMFPKATL